MLTGLVLALLGVLALASLLAATRARFWAIPAVFAMVAGTMLLAPVLGLLALSQAAPAEVQQVLADGGAARGLRLTGLALITVGWLCAAAAVLAADVFSATDGWLIAAGAVIALLGAAVGSPHLVAFAALPALAGTLGVAWHASRIAPDGRLR
jgi:hypothetical protein